MRVTPACETCRWAEPVIGDHDGPRLECRRYPAQCFVLDGQPTQAWPTIYPGDWCGEYAPTDDERAALRLAGELPQPAVATVDLLEDPPRYRRPVRDDPRA